MVDNIVKFIHWWGLILAIGFATMGIIAWASLMFGVHIMFMNVLLPLIIGSAIVALLSYHHLGRYL